jgi:uncharacterized protein YbjT (DUF2867 family)
LGKNLDPSRFLLQVNCARIEIMKIIITGSTGMIGKGALLESLDNPIITEILIVNRTPINFSHPKIIEIICDDWFNLSKIEHRLKGYDACFFCLGATITTISEKYFRKITYALTLNFIQTIFKLNPNIIVCYISGMGVDGTKRRKNMWMHIKGEVEQALLKVSLKNIYIFRPGYIQPLRGVRSKTLLYRLFYTVFSPVYPLIRKLLPTYTTNTVNIGKAMILISKNGYKKPYLENIDINILAQTTE